MKNSALLLVRRYQFSIVDVSIPFYATVVNKV